MSVSPKIPSIDLSRLTPEAGVSKLIGYALLMNASDVFYAMNENNVSIALRHLGILQQVGTLGLELGKRHIAHVRTLAGLDHSEHRRPLDGRSIHRGEDGKVIDLRISTIPTLYGEDLALRLAARDTAFIPFERLGLADAQLEQVSEMLAAPSGLILITGPTGSGKTATMYASLAKRNDGQTKINTIEDPIEYAVDGIRQSQVNPQVDLTFAELLKSVLRQSPDIIMIGEIRDPETADTAVRAANSGHLVLATIHASIAVGAVQSMRSLGVNPHFLASGLRGILSQRLVRTLCPQCKVAIDLSHAPRTFDEVRPWLKPEEGHALHAAKGCPACQQIGYAGRTGVFEVLPVTSSLRLLISDGGTTGQIREEALKNAGMIEFRQGALLKVARGITSLEEVFRVIPSEHLNLEE